MAAEYKPTFTTEKLSLHDCHIVQQFLNMWSKYFFGTNNNYIGIYGCMMYRSYDTCITLINVFTQKNLISQNNKYVFTIY